MANKGRIENGRYYDKNGKELFEGDYIRLDGRTEKLYRTTDGELGTDATNPLWIETGRAVEGEYGIYPLSVEDCQNCRKIKK